MKLLILLTIIACLQASARGFGQTVTLSLNNAPLEKAFKEIKKQTGYSFVYTRVQLKNTQPITLQVKNASLRDVLDLCFNDQPLTYLIEDKYIIIQTKTNASQTTIANAVPIDITGRVIDEKGEPISGATVAVKGSNFATATNERGEFRLSGVSSDAVIRVSNIGYEIEEIEIKGQAYLVIQLKILVNSLDETIVKGYYSTSRRLNTGNVSKVTANDINKQPVSNLLAALQGRVPGLLITQQTGVPGGNFSVRLRGQNSIANGNDPLYIIDGVPFLSSSMASATTSGLILSNGISPLNGINPQDIESIEVLKDADATAIYGSRGANGVILITTKKGKEGKTKVALNFYSGVGKTSRRLDLLSLKDYLEMRNEAFANDASVAQSWDYDLTLWDTTRNTDWQKVLIGGTANITNVQSSISGGNNNTQFLMGGGYNKETTVFPGDNRQVKGSVHINITNTATNQKFKSHLLVNFLTDNNSLLNQDLTEQAMNLPPNAPSLYDASGNLNWENSTWRNPLSFLKTKYNSTTNSLISNLQLSYQLLPGLNLKSSFGYTMIGMSAITTTPKSAYDPSFTFLEHESAFSNGNMKAWIVEPQINWQKKVPQGKVDLMIGATFQDQQREELTQFGRGFANEALMKNLKAANTVSIISNNYTQYRYNAIFGRIHYNVKDKYLLNLTGRRDGSSRFGPGKQFNNFSAIGAGWIFSKENLIQKRLPFLSYGKLRGSYGIAGNDQISDYGFLDTYIPSGPYQGMNGLDPARVFNPDFAWETNKKLEIATELGFFKDRILFSLCYYHNRSSNQLVGLPLPPTTGFPSVQYNLPAVVQNTGLEFEVSAINIDSKQFSWQTSFNLSLPRNKLVKYPNLEGSSFANRYVIGEPLQIRKLFHSLGVNPHTGVYEFDDKDNSGSFTLIDRQTVKFVGAQFYGGLQNSIKYKEVELVVLLQFVKQSGSNYLADSYGFGSMPGTIQNQPALVMNRWRKPGDISKTQRFNQDFNLYDAYSIAQFSDLSIGDASFIRLKNLSLSYRFSEEWMKKIKVQNCRLFIQGQNLFTITNYKGLDPETQSAYILPPLKVLTVGLQITF